MKEYSQEIKELKEHISNAEAIVIGAGAGLSASAGLAYSGERFERYFKDFIEKYRLRDMYSSGFFAFDTAEEYWAYWSRHIYYNRYAQKLNGTYNDLKSLLEDKNYFIITTNVDHVFINSGFSKERIFYTQGDYGLFQCSQPCQDKTYDNESIIRQMIKEQSHMRVPTSLIPLCPICGKEMTQNLRKDNTFVQDEGWYKARERYESFLNANIDKRVLFLELGVGYNTPSIIKYPFWQMVHQSKNSHLAVINISEATCAKEIKNKAICIKCDIGNIIKELVNLP